MNIDVAKQCTDSLYEVIYHYTDGKRRLVKDMNSEHICMSKTLDVYQTEVFQYLKEHPNPHIPRIHTTWMDSSRLVVIEELISGYGLDYILANAKLDHSQRLDILRQICDGLIFLHNANPEIIHLDLKPSNIMLTDDGVVKIIDYAAAKPLNDAQVSNTTHINASENTAPEQYGFGKCDVRTDIYGLGVIIRAMFPTDQEMLQIADRATQLDPDARYQTVLAVLADLPGSSVRTTIQTNNTFQLILHALCQIPGFRTHTPWKMILATLIYMAIVRFALTTSPSDGATTSLLDLWLFRITTLGAMFSIVDAITNWTGLFSHIPLFHNRNLVLRVIGRSIAIFVAFICWALIYALLATILGLS